MTTRDYRIFVGAFPTGQLAADIQAIREQYDPLTARITPPHITLAGTYWRSGPPTPTNEAETIRRLETLSGHLAPFKLRLGRIHTFPGEHPVVYLGVEITPDLLAVRRRLLDLLGQDRHNDFHPHLTLAMRLPADQANEMVRELAGSRWQKQTFSAPIRELRLMQRGPQDVAWRCIHKMVFCL